MIGHIYTTNIIKEHMYMCSFLVWKKSCLNYREFDLEDDLVGVPNAWNSSVQSFITLFKLVWREYDIVAMNEWKEKCVCLQRTWVSKRTVHYNKCAKFTIHALSLWWNFLILSKRVNRLYVCMKVAVHDRFEWIFGKIHYVGKFCRIFLIID